MAFLVVCIAHSGWSLWLLTFANTNNSSDALQQSESMFAAAGMLASGAAIWNIHTVESTFHHYLESYGPFSKFITVKIIVSFAFFQRGAIHVLLAVQDTLPGLASNLLRHFPFIGAIINLPPDQFEIFYACLLCFECLLVAVMHAGGRSTCVSRSLPAERLSARRGNGARMATCCVLPPASLTA